MTVRKAVYIILTLLAVAGALLVLVLAWWRNDWDLEATGMVGDTAAPIVGVLSLLAVGAAIWSVRVQQDALAMQEQQVNQQQNAVRDQLRLQNEALDLQRQALLKQDEQIRQQHEALAAQLDLQRQALLKQDEQIKQQHETFAEQLELQRQALEQQKQELLHQHEALETQLRYQRHAALREAYAPFLSAVSGYHDAVRGYLDRMLKTGCDADRRVRSEWQRPSAEAHANLNRTLHPVLLVDTSAERSNYRWQLLREVHLEPWVDTAENQRAWMDVILYEISERTNSYVALRDSLYKEFGDAVAEQTASAREFDEKMRADLKAKADAAEQRIAAQLEEQLKPDARRKGRLPPGP